MRPLALLLIASLFLAGCNGDAADDGTPGPSPAPTGPTPVLEIKAERPVWSLGDGWVYLVDVPGKRTHTFTMLVAENRTDLWVVAADDRPQALHHAVYSTNPVLGRIGTETLSPFQDDEPVRMFDFPLSDGKTWNARFFGEDMSFTATFAGDVPLQPDVGLGAFAEGFRIQATGSSGTRVLYDFVPAVGWFTAFEVVQDGRQIRLDLLGLVDDYAGPYVFFRGADLVVEDLAHEETTAPAAHTFPFDLNEENGHGLGVGLVYTGGQGSSPRLANTTLRDAAGQVVWQHEFSALGQQEALREFGPDQGVSCPDACGPYTLEILLVGNVDLEVRAVGLQEFATGVL